MVRFIIVAKLMFADGGERCAKSHFLKNPLRSTQKTLYRHFDVVIGLNTPERHAAANQFSDLLAPLPQNGDSQADKDIDFELHELGHEGWDPFRLCLGGAKVNRNVFSLFITEIS